MDNSALPCVNVYTQARPNGEYGVSLLIFTLEMNAILLQVQVTVGPRTVEQKKITSRNCFSFLFSGLLIALSW